MRRGVTCPGSAKAAPGARCDRLSYTRNAVLRYISPFSCTPAQLTTRSFADPSRTGIVPRIRAWQGTAGSAPASGGASGPVWRNPHRRPPRRQHPGESSSATAAHPMPPPRAVHVDPRTANDSRRARRDQRLHAQRLANALGIRRISLGEVAELPLDDLLWHALHRVGGLRGRGRRALARIRLGVTSGSHLYEGRSQGTFHANAPVSLTFSGALSSNRADAPWPDKSGRRRAAC
jgi:hypothetical protein